MAEKKRVNFAFKNQVAPRYIEPLFLQLEYGTWYESTELPALLRAGGLDVQGKEIVNANIAMWGKVGLGEVVGQGHGRPHLFRLTPLGNQIRELYSTNQALFFDLMHYFFYSAWRRSRHVNQAPSWLYAEICNQLWQDAPGKMESMALTRLMQSKGRHDFPDLEPIFPDRMVMSVFPWLQTLTPPFLSKCGTKSELCSERRSYCTPQLFHLAVELAYAEAGLQYGTSLAIDDEQIAAICRTCLLSTDKFWDMASLTDMAMREMEVRKGQWATSLALTGPPRWIELPSFADQDEDDA